MEWVKKRQNAIENVEKTAKIASIIKNTKRIASGSTESLENFLK